jgi:crossover junction endodeoxyribonuclease RuvC
MRVLSIDPGYDRVGIAVLEKKANGKNELLYSTCITTSAGHPFELRLKHIGTELGTIITSHEPTVCATETLYFHSNQKTALLVAEARGVIRYSAALYNLPIFEYTPLQIKQAVTGNGRADKKQVMDMVKLLLPIKKEIRFDDEFDAIAIGITCLASERA